MPEDKKDEKMQKKEPESYLAPPTPKPEVKKAKDRGIFTGLRVSLMPDELQGRATANLRRMLLILALVMIVETAIVGGTYFFVKSYTDKQADRLDTMVADIGRIQKANKVLEESALSGAAFGPQVMAGQAALEDRLAWTPLFRYLEKITLPTVNYVTFTSIAEKGYVSLDCIAGSFRDAAEQLVMYGEAEHIIETKASSMTAEFDDKGNMLGVTFGVNLILDQSLWDAELLFDENNQPVVSEDEETAVPSDVIVIPTQPPAETESSAASDVTPGAAVIE